MRTGQPPPHDLDAEMSVLGACLESREAIADVIEQLHADDFYKPAHGLVFAAILNLYGSGEQVDVVTVADELQRSGDLVIVGGKPTLFDLTQAYSTASAASKYADIVRDMATLRRVISAADAAKNIAYSIPDDVRAALDRVEGLIFDAAEKSQRGLDDTQIIKPILGDVMTVLEERGETRDLSGIATGFPMFDEMTGGLQPGSLYYIGARPSQGKTAWLLNVAVNAAALGHPVFVASIEMARRELVERILCSKARVPSDRLRSGRLKEIDWANLSEALGKIAEYPLFISDSAYVSVMSLRAKARRLKAKHGLSMVVVDYLGLMEMPDAERRELQVGEVSRSLKLLARDLEVPVLCATQLNRGVEMRSDKRPILSDLRDSGTLEQDGDLVAFLYRDFVYHDTADPTQAELIVAKQRNGPIGTIPMSFIANYTLFSENHDGRRA